MSVKLIVNNETATVDAPPEMPLLWVLRDLLDLQGSKYGCGIGACGACTVLIDGKPTRSCITTVGSVGQRKIITIEGLSNKGTHLVQQAWAAIDVPQCGYCQAGQIMAAVALLERTPNPTDVEIDAAMSGNLCRCGTYTRIREAIHQAAGTASTGK